MRSHPNRTIGTVSIKIVYKLFDSMCIILNVQGILDVQKSIKKHYPFKVHILDRFKVKLECIYSTDNSMRSIIPSKLCEWFVCQRGGGERNNFVGLVKGEENQFLKIVVPHTIISNLFLLIFISLLIAYQINHYTTFKTLFIAHLILLYQITEHSILFLTYIFLNLFLLYFHPHYFSPQSQVDHLQEII